MKQDLETVPEQSHGRIQDQPLGSFAPGSSVLLQFLVQKSVPSVLENEGKHQQAQETVLTQTVPNGFLKRVTMWSRKNGQTGCMHSSA